MTTSTRRLLPALLALGFLCSVDNPQAAEPGGWSDEVKKALGQAGDNAAELRKALEKAPPDQARGIAFLVANMPVSDLRSLKADFLLENVDLAYRARKAVPWGARIPEEIFLNDVLPYASVDEARDPWRKELFELCLPLVKDCKTPAEAAHALNSAVFKKLAVRYSTTRKQPHQSPKESIEQGVASCTGLSILLADSCRSVAVPARLVGTPLWANKRGNHTWVEVWDGDWHFTGACEADPKGLDRGWFVGDAAQALEDNPIHAIYATSFRKTAVSFPLVWSPGRKDVFAENVTRRYAKKEEAPKKAGLTAGQLEEVSKAATKYFQASAEEQAKLKLPDSLDSLLGAHEEEVRQAVWKAYQAAPIHAAQKKDFEANVVRTASRTSPYTVKKVGVKPKGGWPLFIAMHGGGGVPKAVNDSQWKIMQSYYRDQPLVTGYQYVALRAPNDAWNGFYDDAMPPVVIDLIRQFLLFGEVDPDRVFLMGYSHGGYGAFFLGPKMPDRFAAVHASASAPTDGTISPLTLRNTRFTFMIGEKDTAYGRRERCQKFAEAVEKLKKENKSEFPVEMELKNGFGHGGLPDRDKIAEMYPHVRNAAPRHLTWELTDGVLEHFFWLSAPKPEKGASIEATVRDNAVKVSTGKPKEFRLYLDGRLVSFEKPVRLEVNGKARSLTLRPSLLTLCRSLAERGDPRLAFSCEVGLE